MFDKSFREAAVYATREFGEKTPKATTTTARGWQKPKFLGPSHYEVLNKVKTTDGKRLIIDILDKGRGEIRPVKAKRLYIPLTQRAKSKKTGARIPKNFVYGVDYVLTKRAKAVKGLNFMKPALRKTSIFLSRAIIKTIRNI